MCTGPESSGTRMLSRLVRGLGVKASHRSIPHGMKWWDQPDGVTHIISVVRDPFMTEASARGAEHYKYWEGVDAEFPHRILKAQRVLAWNAEPFGDKWLPLTYDGLLIRPQWTMDRVAEWLGVEPQPLSEKVVDPRSPYGP
jgi:hypothetical protein